MGNRYEVDALVIGGGAAGLTAAGIAAHLGARTVLVERDRMGGDCTWTGCIPSKTLLKAAKVAHQARNAARWGLSGSDPQIDIAAVMRHVNRVRERVYEEADHPRIYEKMGIEVCPGSASFTDSHTVRVTREDAPDREITARYIFICTGSRPAVPDIIAGSGVHFLTTDSLFEADTLPGSVAVLGAGPVGIEMAQALARLGSRVSVIDRTDRILSAEDPELAEILSVRLQMEGISIQTASEIRSVERTAEGVRVQIDRHGSARAAEAAALFVAAGRSPDLESLNLEAAGVEHTGRGVTVDERCRTSRRHIHACGDVTGEYRFTHMSEHMAKVAVVNALLKIPKKIDRGQVPRVTYTDPELAGVGATEEQLNETGRTYRTYRFPYSKIDRALSESEGEGLIKIRATPRTGRILGAGVTGTAAGEIICEYALAMKNGLSMRHIADTIHPYPSWGLGARRAADQWYIGKQSEWSVKLIQKLFGYRGEVPDFSDPDRVV